MAESDWAMKAPSLGPMAQVLAMTSMERVAVEGTTTAKTDERAAELSVNGIGEDCYDTLPYRFLWAPPSTPGMPLAVVLRRVAGCATRLGLTTAPRWRCPGST